MPLEEVETPALILPRVFKVTPKIRLDLSDSRCRKPFCKHAGKGPPNRHHLRHEKTWINLWNRLGPPPFRKKREWGRRLFRLLKERYYQFRPQDVVVLCEWHHVEIHLIYRIIVLDAQVRFGKTKSKFSFEEALWVMRECKKACLDWLRTSSQGQNPNAAKRKGLWGKQ